MEPNEAQTLQFVIDEEGTNTHIIVTVEMFEALMESLESNVEDPDTSQELLKALEGSQMVGDPEGAITHMIVVTDLFDRIMTTLDEEEDEE